MDFPDPSELWNYRQRLQRHGFSPAEATAVVTAAVTGTAHTHDAAELDTRADWVDSAANVVSQCGDGGDTRLANTQVMQSETLAGMAGTGSSPKCDFITRDANLPTMIRCEPSRMGQLAYLFVCGGHSVLSRGEATLLRDTLTAILEEGS